MLICQWHLEILYGRQSEALAILRAWGADKFAHSGFRSAKGNRVLVGAVGASPSHVVDEYEFESLADFEAGLRDMGDERFRSHSDRLTPLVVPGSQKWVVWRTA
jgi:hypothetical protein